MKETRTVIKISVRELVEFILRSGDLDNRRGSRAEREAMQAGSRIHRKLQRQQGAGYRAEVPLKYTAVREDFDCVIEGRADGIFTEEGLLTVDEIKGVYRDLEGILEPAGVHLAQAMCYAYFYAQGCVREAAPVRRAPRAASGEMNLPCPTAEKEKLPRVGIRMTYCNLETEDVKYFYFTYTFEELEKWFEALMAEYEKWAGFQAGWRKVCRESIRSLTFPFPYRDGQKKLASDVYRAIARRKRLFIQAPTGVGKTISTVFPAVKAMGEGLGEKIFYLTAKTITRTVAEEAFEVMRGKGLRLKSVTLTAKEKLCICEETDCNPDHCPYAKGHFDRVNQAVYELLTQGPDDLDRETLLEQAHKHRVCPFEMSLDVSNWTDAVICDYNYVFDPNVRLKRFFSEGAEGDYIFLIDEAHNLVERGREMFSAALYKEDFLELKKKIKGRGKKAERALERCNKYLLDRKRECEDYRLLEDVGAFSLQIMNLMGELEKLLEEGGDGELAGEIQDFWFRLRDFQNIYERIDENYVIYSRLEEDGRFKLKLYCVETAKNLRECLDKGASAVFFSATLLPMPYYKHLLGDQEDYAIYARSPFSQDQRLILVGRDVSSRYRRRSRQEYEKIAAYIARMAEGKRGNYLVFFPSYRMLLDVHAVFEAEYETEEMECLLQYPGMKEEKREEFLEKFSLGQKEKSLLGFCVMGGIFSEGIDLKREALIGAVIVGTGLPMVCCEREILKKYYENQGMDGFAYAYLYPGMNKVLQAAGRVIRTQEDKGAVLLLDQRFLQGEYRKLFPLEWEKHQICTLDQVEERLSAFWED